jgi:predicted aspartyl protease
MQTLRTDVGVASIAAASIIRVVEHIAIDPGAQLTWLPEVLLEELGVERVKECQFVLESDELVFREVGYAILHIDGNETVDEVVFAEPHDVCRIGARTIGGLGYTADLRAGMLLDSGPIPA